MGTCASYIKDADGRQRVNRVTVFERPGLHEFLQRTSEFADLVLFTAGLEGLCTPELFIVFHSKRLVDFTSHLLSVFLPRIRKTCS